MSSASATTADATHIETTLKWAISASTCGARTALSFFDHPWPSSSFGAISEKSSNSNAVSWRAHSSAGTELGRSNGENSSSSKRRGGGGRSKAYSRRFARPSPPAPLPFSAATRHFCFFAIVALSSAPSLATRAESASGPSTNAVKSGSISVTSSSYR